MHSYRATRIGGGSGHGIPVALRRIPPDGPSAGAPGLEQGQTGRGLSVLRFNHASDETCAIVRRHTGSPMLQQQLEACLLGTPHMVAHGGLGRGGGVRLDGVHDRTVLR